MKTIKELMQEPMLSTYDGIKIDTLKEVVRVIDEDIKKFTILKQLSIVQYLIKLKTRIEGK